MKLRRPKSKDEFLLQQLREWWSCIRESEIAEGLMGASGTNPKDVKKFYPQHEGRGETVRKDVYLLLDRIQALFEAGIP